MAEILEWEIVEKHFNPLSKSELQNCEKKTMKMQKQQICEIGEREAQIAVLIRNTCYRTKPDSV